MRYHVFIEGSRDRSPGAQQRLAVALGEKYGMSPQIIGERLAQGRFCAWTSLDVGTARRLAGELDQLGAAYTLVEDQPGVPVPGQARQTALGVGPSPARSHQASAPPASGLAAAYRRETEPEVDLDLGNLRPSPEDEGWRLSRIDGTEGTGESRVFTPEPVTVERPRPVSAPPPLPRAPADPFAPPTVADPFAPPDMERAPDMLELGDKPAVSGTVASSSTPLPTISTYRGAPTAGSETLHKDSFIPRMRELMAESDRARFAAGVMVAFLIGLVPAQVFASWRNSTAYDEIRADLADEYAGADTPDTWGTLESARDDARALVASRQQRVAVGALLVWALAGGAIAFVWFRLIDWDRAVPRIAPAQESGAAAAAARRRATR